MMQTKFSSNFEAVRSRIRRLPKMLEKIAETQNKKDAKGIINEYQAGLKKNNLGLQKLHPFSIEKKIENGYSKPRNPLYGEGDSLDRTLYNGIEIKKKGNRYYVQFSRKKHHKAKLTIAQLQRIHENGAVIAVTPRMRAFLHWYGLHLKATTQVIRIPPRQAFSKAVNKYLRKRKKEETVFQVKQAILALINENKSIQLNRLMRYEGRQ